MVLNAKDKELMLSALQTESARVKRAMNSSANQSIKEIHQAQLFDLQELVGRVSKEPVK